MHELADVQPRPAILTDNRVFGQPLACEQPAAAVGDAEKCEGTKGAIRCCCEERCRALGRRACLRRAVYRLWVRVWRLLAHHEPTPRCLPTHAPPMASKPHGRVAAVAKRRVWNPRRRDGLEAAIRALRAAPPPAALPHTFVAAQALGWSGGWRADGWHVRARQLRPVCLAYAIPVDSAPRRRAAEEEAGTRFAHTRLRQCPSVRARPLPAGLHDRVARARRAPSYGYCAVW
jgi:hypothetical protein